MEAADWDARYAATQRVWAAAPNQFVAAELSELPPGRALDLAAGEGRNAIWLAERGWQVTAIDFSAVAIERGRSSGGGVDWVVGDVATHLLPSAVDLVLISYLQLPKPEMVPIWRRAFAAVRPGGTFFVISHDSSNLDRGVGGPQDPNCLHTAADVIEALEDVEFEMVKADCVARQTETGTAFDALVRLVRR